MIATVQEMAAETSVHHTVIRAYLNVWRKRGWAKLTGRTKPSGTVRSGPPCKLWEVRDGRWEKFLNRSVRNIDYLALDGPDYKREAYYRYRNRVGHIKRVYRQLRAASFARRNPFVVL